MKDYLEYDEIFIALSEALEKLNKIEKYIPLDVELDKIYIQELHFKGMSYGDILRKLKTLEYEHRRTAMISGIRED
jgi:hypothetical protein